MLNMFTLIPLNLSFTRSVSHRFALFDTEYIYWFLKHLLQKKIYKCRHRTLKNYFCVIYFSFSCYPVCIFVCLVACLSFTLCVLYFFPMDSLSLLRYSGCTVLFQFSFILDLISSFICPKCLSLIIF